MVQLLKQIIKTAVFTSTTALTVIVTLVLLFAVLAGIGASFSDGAEGDTQPHYRYHFGDKESENTILSIPITGLILGEQYAQSDFASLFTPEGVTYGYEVKQELLDAAKDTKIGGVILEVDSPGGTIYGSKAIADGIAEYRKQTGKPVVAFVAGMAASGGYWAIAGADSITADSGTGIGSIGVISGPYKFYDRVVSEDAGAFFGGVVTSGGVKTQYITAGEHKDMGNPYRELTQEEVSTIQTMVDDSYAQFVAHVASGRELDETTVRTAVKALLYGEVMAKKLGLIDVIEDKQTAYAAVATQAGFSQYQIKQKAAPHSVLDTLLSVSTNQQRVTPTASGLQVRCPLSNLVLAYHGDLFSLCR